MLLRFSISTFFFVFLIFVTTVSGLVHLRKHRHPIYSAEEEPTIINAMHQQEETTQQQQQNQSNRQAELHNFRHDDACGEATLSCMAFAHTKIGIPVRCGMLKNAPVCMNGRNKCSAFCDADGGARVCHYAFPKCCSQSANGCTTSEPRHTKHFPLKKGQ
ncbi:hypothetical protein BDA99DRAFT_557559 [Phascolomyces articulosus]|uniref:Uncharacterized protein n=1 Tax=Phascolomyces articulosus TaxID=60185 RepID=A0AAD5KHB1_9FUNG|nr:hypothetical protein BDA99DRAFT_557559 [Phascolomyces articulosus]